MVDLSVNWGGGHRSNGRMILKGKEQGKGEGDDTSLRIMLKKVFEWDSILRISSGTYPSSLLGLFSI